MKHHHYILLITLFFNACLTTFAYDFKVDGIAYNVVSFSENTVEIAVNDGIYSGNFVVPEYVTYNGRSLKVLGFGRGALDSSTITSLSLHKSIYFKDSSITNLLKSLKSINVDNILVWLECSIKVGNYEPNPWTSDIKNVSHGKLLSAGAVLYVNGDTLRDLVIPSSVKKIRYACFYGYQYFRTIKLPNGLENIESYAFASCPKINSLSIPNSVMNIGLGALCATDTLKVEDGLIELKMYENYSIANEKLYIGRNITHYPNRGFNLVYPCSLKELEIGTYVDTISAYRYIRDDYRIGIAAFNKEENLSKITVHGRHAPCGPLFHNQTYMNAILSIPPGSKENFGWNNFWNIREDAEEGWKANHAINSAWGDFEESLDDCGWQTSDNIHWGGHSIFLLSGPKEITTKNRIRFRPGEYILKFKIWSTGIPKDVKLSSVSLLGKDVETYCILGDLVSHNHEVRFQLLDEFEDYLTIRFGVTLENVSSAWMAIDDLYLYDFDTYYVEKRYFEESNAVEELSWDRSDKSIVEYYSIDGKKIKHPQHGIYIIRFSDGNVKKIYR